MSRANCRCLCLAEVSSWVIIICLFAPVPFLASAQSTDEMVLRSQTEKFFAAYRNADLNYLMSLWSEKSPDLATRKRTFQRTFSGNKMELKSLTTRKISVENGKAKVRVVADISAVDLKTDKEAAGFGVMNRTLHFVKEGEEWKVWRYAVSEVELAAVLASMKKADERKALLEAEKELVTVELVKELVEQGGRPLVLGVDPSW